MLSRCVLLALFFSRHILRVAHSDVMLNLSGVNIENKGFFPEAFGRSRSMLISEVRVISHQCLIDLNNLVRRCIKHTVRCSKSRRLAGPVRCPDVSRCLNIADFKRRIVIWQILFCLSLVTDLAAHVSALL